MRPHSLGWTLAGILVAACAFLAAPALATTVTLSTASSDATDPADLDATFDFSVSGTTLTLTVTNTGVANTPSDFNVNGIWFNGSTNVTGLSLTSATHSAAGDVSAAWLPIELNDTPDGFGAFDFGLTDGVGQNNANVIEPGESIVFVFAISGGGSYTDADFIVANGSGYEAAAKFVNGPPDPECAGLTEPTEACPDAADTEDSAFGAVPEPALVWLLFATGLAALHLRKA